MTKVAKKNTINVKGTEVALYRANADDYISLTDMAKYRDKGATDQIIQNWMRTYATIEFLGLWEKLYNPDFKPLEFEGFKNRSGSNSFVLTPKRWIEGTNAIGITSKSGRYGGTFAHRYIAFEFATWLSADFKLYLVHEFDRLKSEEQQSQSLEWNLQRTISKINYRIHTDAIKEHIIPPVVTKAQAKTIYASEADMLNVALFGKTAAEWRSANPAATGNIRDEATLEQLIVLSNMESINALLIEQDLAQSERLVQLNQVAIAQLTSLVGNRHIRKLGDGGGL
ncbi:MAG: KilA-N domain-containing protein [Clostridiales Family XIII bacterium]|jgi:hypothetical protein|nr:KilA-N domain-containing protein [Clostridiales Family XIII bacterium]